MIIFIVIMCYLLLHFLFCVFYAKKIIFLKTENGIFYTHFLSFVVSAMIALVIFLSDPFSLLVPKILIVISVHGIYSLSFLELWSLAQGGYSLQILNFLESNDIDFQLKILNLEKIGDKKFSNRITAIKNLKLIHIDNNKIYLTMFGKISAIIFMFIVILTGIKDRG